MQRITIDPQVEAGAPCVGKQRVRVKELIDQLAEGKAIKQILAEHPELTREDLVACLEYAADEKLGTYFS